MERARLGILGGQRPCAGPCAAWSTALAQKLAALREAQVPPGLGGDMGAREVSGHKLSDPWGLQQGYDLSQGERGHSHGGWSSEGVNP